MPTTQHKGNSLEGAVRAIEAAILHQGAGYDEKTLRIEGKKRIKTKDGVPHEIDIWVTVEIALGYTATYIFECKNWKNKVGKEDVSAFADKIAAAQAQRGFLVAKVLTRGALARLKSDPRMELLSVRELSLDEVPPRVRRFFGLFTKIVEREFVVVHGYEQGKTTPLDMKAAFFMISGIERDLAQYLMEWTDKVVKGCPCTEGVHPFESSRVFPSGDVRLNHEEVQQIKLSGTLRVSRIPGIIVSRFEVSSRGRVIQCLVEYPNGTRVVMQELILFPKVGFALKAFLPSNLRAAEPVNSNLCRSYRPCVCAPG